MLDRQQHEQILKNILRDILKDNRLSPQLALKGGTCLYLFHNLPRFSVDLDFNLMKDTTFEPDNLTEIVSNYLNIEDQKEKKFTWFWLGNFEKGRQKIKVEISKRQFPDKYEVKQFYGLSANTMTPEYMFAHKLCAITDRTMLQNRDLYDSWFMFKNQFPINEQIIISRTNNSTIDYLTSLKKHIQKNINPSGILNGLGELLDQSQKEWVKANLLDELIFQIQLKIESLNQEK